METLLSLALPLGLTAVIGLAFGGNQNGNVSLPPIGVAVLDRDDSFMSGLMAGALGGIDGENAPITFDVRAVGSEDEAWRGMREGEISAMLEIPAGMSDSLFGGGTVDFRLVRNPSERILPEIVEQVIGVGVVLLSEATTHLAGPLDRMQAMGDSLDAWPDELAVASISAAWSEELRRFEKWVFPPIVTLSVSSAEDDSDASETGPSIDIFAYILPGIAFLGLLFLAAAGHRDLFTERSMGTFHRIAAAPAGVDALLASKFASASAIAAIGLLLLLGSGAIIFGSRWGDPMGLALMVLSGSIAASGMVGLLYGGARTERQAETLAPILILSVSFVGGSMIPLSELPGFARSVAPFTPNYWLIDGLRSLAASEANWLGVLKHAGVLTGFGLSGMALGMGLVRRRSGSGV
ncbi:MAG: hypothetical protein CME06_15645 [Gemmatimonadetes bacterium]|nr:hypothetical protein [Gemmatimonadota bacterium]